MKTSIGKGTLQAQGRLISLKPGLIGMAVVCIFILAAPFRASAATITVLNFDSIPLSAGACTSNGTLGTAYLGGFGITLSSPLAVAFPQICNGMGTNVTAVSAPNWFALGISASENNKPLSYTLTFTTPLDSVSFDYAALTTFITFPTWTATAYNGATPVGSVGQAGGFGTGSSSSYSIAGPGITSLTFAAFSSGQSTNQPTIDNLTLFTTTTPEPSSLLLLGAGLVALMEMCFFRRQRV